jgi:UTP--glucose-1-phosphate uridylyltransferase
MHVLTGGAPKELLRLGGEPVLVTVARECAASGIDELLVVTAPGKERLIGELAPRTGAPGLPRRIEFVEQSEPRGLADAIGRARAFAAGEPIGVALPDNLFLGTTPALGQLIETYAATGRNVVAVVEILAEEAPRRGPTAIYHGRRSGERYELERIPDKGERAERFDTDGAASAFTGVGRYVLDEHAFAAIDHLERSLPAGAERDDVPMLQHLLAHGRLVGHLVGGRFLDVGLPEGYREAAAVLDEDGPRRGS